MKWITNCARMQVEPYKEELSSGWPNRRIEIGPPMPTEWCSEQELSDRGVVGLYDLDDYRAV